MTRNLPAHQSARRAGSHPGSQASSHSRGVTVWSAVVPVTAAVAGVLFATSAQTARGTDLRSAEGGDLAGLIRAQARGAEQKASDVAVLRAQVDRLTAQAAPGNARVSDLWRRADALAPVAGLEAVQGPAVRVRLDDAKRTAESLPSGFTADDIVVHQQDVQGVVNALWAGGAEAMMLQDQRVISTSAVRCVGNTLILQGRVYSPPYVVTAIGDTARMQRSLVTSPTVAVYRQYVDVLGLGYDVSALREARFPAYGGSVSLVHARATTATGTAG